MKVPDKLGNVLEYFVDYKRAKQEGELSEFYLQIFIQRRDDYMDELPEQDVRNSVSIDENGHFVELAYKCRGHYIIGLCFQLQSAVRDGVIKDGSLISRIQELGHHDFRFHHGEFTTPDEIDMMNSVLDDVIEYLDVSE